MKKPPKTLAQLRADREDANRHRKQLFEQMAPIQRSLEHNHKKISSLDEQIGRLMVAEATTPDWPQLVKETGEGGMAMHNYMTEQFRTIGLWPEGYWMDTNDRCLRIMMTRDDPESFKKTKAAVELTAPLLTPHADGLVWYGIFEHNLSAHGIWMLKVTPDLREAKVSRDRWDDNKASGTLDVVLSYIQDQLYYDRKDNSGEND